MIMETLKEILITYGMFVLCIFILPVLSHKLLYLFARVTYSLAHRKDGKITNARTKNMIVYNIDTKAKTLQEIQAERNEMMRILGGF